MLPMLNAKPPMTTSIIKKKPRPGNNLLARSCALNSLMVSMRHVFNCAPISSNTETNITKPKLVISCCVNTVVCVRNPGPMEELAIKNAAPSTAELLLKKLILFCFFVTIFCAAIKHRCVTHLYRIPILSMLTFLPNIRQVGK